MGKKAIYLCPFGFLGITHEGEKVTFLDLVKDAEKEEGHDAFTDSVFREVTEYLEGKRKKFDFAIKLSGTPFQKKVWKELIKIPYGETRTYKEIAEAVGCPKAYRAVGMANNRNPVIFAVPCHRVIGSNGNLTGYAWGVSMKKWLLDMEKAHKEDIS